MDLNSTSPPTRIGLFGGSFDPPHKAHTALAAAAIDQLALDVLLVVPTGDAWHKPRHLTAAEHRLAMVRLAFKSEPRVVIDELEIQRSGPSYTIDTLRTLNERYVGASFFLIMGADQAVQFSNWHKHNEIQQLAQLAIADRSLDQVIGQQSSEWHNPELKDVVQLHLPLMPLSATDIRLRCHSGADLSAFLQPEVIQYIQNNHLYMDSHDRSH